MLALIDKLSPDLTDEDNLNAMQLMTELLESKAFFKVVARRSTIVKLSEYAFNEENCVDSRNAALTVLAKIAMQLNEKQKDGNKEEDDEFKNVDNDEDDMIIKQDSDEESNGSDNQVIEELASKITNIKDIFLSVNPAVLNQSMAPEPVHAFGQLRLKALELLH